MCFRCDHGLRLSCLLKGFLIKCLLTCYLLAMRDPLAAPSAADRSNWLKLSCDKQVPKVTSGIVAQSQMTVVVINDKSLNLRPGGWLEMDCGTCIVCRWKTKLSTFATYWFLHHHYLALVLWSMMSLYCPYTFYTQLYPISGHIRTMLLWILEIN